MAKQPTPIVPKVNPLREQALKLSEKADKTLGYNREIVDKVGLGKEAEFKGIQTYYGTKAGDFFDPYEDYIDTNTLKGGEFNVDELNKLRAVNQSNWQQAGHAVARVATNIVPQIVSGFASMVDIPGYWDAEHAAQNSIVNWAQDLKKEVDEDWFPIYEETPQSMNISDPAWWMSRGSGLVESIGAFAATGLVGGKLISSGLKGLGAITKGKDLTRAIIGAEKSKNLLTATSTLGNAVAMNQTESVISATEVFNSTYQEKLAQGWKRDKAKQAASEAAATTMNLNRINILFNLTSARAFISPVKSTREILKRATGLDKLGHLVLEGGQEAAEELVNLVAEKAGKAKGKQQSYSFNDALKDMKTMEGFEAAFLGALGGMGQKGITSASEYSKYGAESTKDSEGNRISKVSYENDRYAKQQEVIEELKAKGVNVTDVMLNFKDSVLFQEKLYKAAEKGDTAEVENLKQQVFENKAIQAFQSGSTQVLEDLYRAEAEKDPAEVGQEYIDNANRAITELKELEAIYNNFEDYANVDEIFFNRANKNRATRNSKYTEQLKKETDFVLNKDIHTIADKYSYDREREVLIKKDGKVVRTDTIIDKVPLSYASSDLETNQGKTEAEQKVYDKFLAEVKALPSYKDSVLYNDELEKIQKLLATVDEEFATITSKEYQKKAEERKVKQALTKEAYATVNTSTSIAEIEKLKETVSDPDFDKVADKKIADLQKSNDIAAKQKQIKIVVEKLQEKIKNAKVEDINALSDEIENSELSQKNKTILTQALNKKSNILNGIEEEVVEEDNPLAKFGSKDPQELENEVEKENASFDTNIPPDLPNPNTETKNIEEGVADAAGKLITEDKTIIIGEDSQGNLVYGYTRSTEGYNRAAFLSREFNQSEVIGRIDREEFTDKLEDDLDLLNPDFLIAGTPLNMQIDAEYEKDKYDPTSNTRQKTPWVLRQEALQKQADAQGIPLTSLPEYIAEVPIKVTNDAGDIVFYVHDNAWYRAENLSATKEEIAIDKEKNFKIREAIVNKSTPVKTKVSYKSFGKLFKTFDGKSLPISEAMPDPNLILAVGRNAAFQLSGDTSTILKGGTILKSTAEEGRLYAIVKVGPKEYLPIPLERQPISKEVIDTIMFAIEAHLTGDTENPIVKAIAESSLGLDITTTSGLTQYLNQFIYLFPTQGPKGLDNYLIRGGEGSSLKSNMPLISVTATGIEFGRPGVNMGSYDKPDGTRVVRPSIVLSQNFKSKVGEATNTAGLNKLRALLEDSRYTPLANASRKDLDKNADSVIILDEDGNTSTIKYSDQIKQSHKTNVISINVGTGEDPIWAYTIQPTILFDTSFANIAPTKKRAAAVPKLQKVTPSKKPALRYKGVNPTVDLIITRTVNGEKQVLLIRRGDTANAEPGKLAFPGGFHDTTAKPGNKWRAGKETVEEAARRELKEETGFDLSKSNMPITLEKVGTFSDQTRDPRNSESAWISSTVFRINLPENFDMSTEVSGQDDAQEARWVPISELSTTDKSQFGFDHADILESEGLASFREGVSAPTSTALEVQKADIERNNTKESELAFNSEIIEKFTAVKVGPLREKRTPEEAILELTNFLKETFKWSEVTISFNKEAEYFMFTINGVKFTVDGDMSFDTYKDITTATIGLKLNDITNAKYNAELDALGAPDVNQAEIDKIEKRRQEELDKNTQDIITEDVRRPNGGIGTQGFDPSQMKDLVSFLNDKLGLSIPKNLLDKNNDSLKPLIDFIKDNNLTNKIVDYVKSNPSETTTLPDGTIEFKDGNHRANLLNILGSKILPTIDQALSKEINAKYDAELAALQPTPVSDKKADIEKRRQASLKDIKFVAADFDHHIVPSLFGSRMFTYLEDAQKAVNDYYDKELAVLEQPSNVQAKTKEEIKQEIIALQKQINTYKYGKEQKEIFDNLNKDILPEGFRFKETEFGKIEKFIPEENKWISVVDNILLKDKDPLKAIDLYFNQKGLGKKISELKKEYLNQIKPFQEKEAQEDADLEKKQVELLSTKEGILLRKDWSAGIGLDYDGASSQGVIENADSKNDTDKFTGEYFGIEENGLSWQIYEIKGATKQEVLDEINADYDAELAALKEPTVLTPLPTAEQEVETLTGEALIEAYAQDIVNSVDNISSIENMLENINLNVISESEVIALGFNSLQEAIAAFTRAKEIFIENSKESKTITLPNGLVIKVDKNTKDTNNISEDEIDELVPAQSEEQLDSQREEVEQMIIRGLDSTTQGSLIAYLSSDIITQTLATKEVDGKQKVQVKPILDKHLKSFKELASFYREQGLENKANRLEAVVAQFDKVRRLVNQNMSKFSTGTVDENIELDSNEQASGLVRTAYTDDWAFTVSSKSTSSADLKKFFSMVQAQDENGPITNILGLPEILTFDTVDNTLKELLTNKPADYGLMLDILELNTEKFPWIKSVITLLEAAPEKIRNEFVSDMSKHHIDMQFIMWSKDYNGNYSLQKWSSNSSSLEQRLRNIWNSNLKGVATRSNLVTVDENDVYIFNAEVGNSLVTQAAEWAKDPNSVTENDLAIWLGNFGIVLTDATYSDLRKGKFNNRGRKSWTKLFTDSAGLVKVLATSLDKNIKGEVTLDDSLLLNDSVVKALAKLEATNNLNTFSNSFQAGGKTIYSYGNNNFLVNRMRDLTAYNDEDNTFVNADLIDNLKKISFAKSSTWLGDLTNSTELGTAMRNAFKVKYLSLEALKKSFTKSQDNKKLNKLTTAEHEVTKIAFFQNVSGNVINGESRRTVDFFYPTMSDKTTMLTIGTLARQLKLENGEISAENIELLYDALVTPEIDRIRDKQADNIKGYQPNYFYFLNTLNTLMVTTGEDADGKAIQKSFLDIVKDQDDFVYSEAVKSAVLAEIRTVINTLTKSKLADWKQLGIGEIVKDSKGKTTDNFSFLDKEYMSKVANAGIGAARVRYAAMDYVFNSLIANAEIYKLFVGDPALYAKFDSKNTLEQNLKETFTNLGKRLAGDIAPGIELANSANNKYYQVFLQDKKIASNNVKDTIQKEFFEKIVSTYADAKKGYGAIEGSDAQEYTTWKEHLYVLKQLGRLTAAQYNAFYTKLEAQSRGDFRETNKLTFEEFGLVLQPLKPVYVGNILSVEENVDRRVYIKSSSFPLIPQLTATLEIDKIRQGLEKFETEVGSKETTDGTPAFVRASFETANKVGAVKNAVEVFDDAGNIVNNFNIKPENALLLSRANFRIQQDVPYKREKDSVNIGTQERKLLFVNTLDLEIEPGVTGEDLLELYNKNYEELFQYAQENLQEKLGLTEITETTTDISSLLNIPSESIFDKVEQFQEELKNIKPITKVEKQQEFAEEMGEITLERVNFINKNFNKIIEGLVAAKMNVFFDENNQFKKCE